MLCIYIGIMPNISDNQHAKILCCDICDFSTSKESNYNKHILTRKHQTLTNPNNKNADSEIKTYDCKCGKTYKHLSTLSNHRKTCSIVKNIHLTILPINNVVIDNKEEDKVIIELLIKENTIISNNNNNNKTFNLQFFLNEQCKDAMNITDFANSFDLQLSDLETVGELGYVNGITKIMVDKLNAMDIYKRPIHCSDAKREIIYVKDENVWTKEEKDNPKLRQAIKNVSFRNMKLVYNWSNAYPESKDNQTKLNDKYMQLVIESTGGNSPILESENKIIRRIAKEIVIEKMHN